MLHHGGENLIPSLQIGSAPTPCHQIDRRRRTRSKNYLAGMLGVQQCLRFFACLFVQLGAAFTQRMNATMHIGIVAFVYVANRVDHLDWSLCARCIV